MDQEKAKSSSPNNITKSGSKAQLRHQEHNYTNPPKEETIAQKVEPGKDTNSSGSENPRLRSPSVRIASSQHKYDNNHRQSVQPNSTTPSDKHPIEIRSRHIKKDVFNRIRRPEEELQKAAEMVRGGMTFQTASDTFNIPISTIRFYMARRGILPQRRRGRGSSGVRDDDLIHPPFEIIHYRLPDIDKPL